eukprot:GFKZ01002402.1.p1 GENE.GFKZ01002402.1~~GFKZ01002402.1.p1  ORF type:complete len:792 (+),score=126.23 GFKZ01002402.1:286-2661(+)
MEPEPDTPLPRPSEALVIVVDTFITSTNPATFLKLRDIAMRLARTRLIYSHLKDDIMATIASGSPITRNKLADQTVGGYQGIEVLQPPATKSLTAVRTLADMTQGTVPSNLMNILEVCGDLLLEPAAERAEKKRVVLFTEGNILERSLGRGEQDLEDFEECTKLFKEHRMQVDIVSLCDENQAQRLVELEEETAELEAFSVPSFVQRESNFPLACLFALCKATGGFMMSYQEASPLVDTPTPKAKLATAKYRGTLNIADIIRIPVKRFTHVLEARAITGKKISWESTVKLGKAVPVLVETQRVASTKDDSPLEAEQLVKSYPYGPELVPERNEVDTAAWSIHLPRGLDVLGFVEQSSVPHRLFMGQVDVVVAMPGVEEAFRLMKTLVLALQAERLGILARSVTPKSGGPPRLVFLWPRVELDTRGVMKNFFLFQVEVPMREDIRDMPFASLEEPMDKVSGEAVSAMDKYISSLLMETSDARKMSDGDEDDAEPDEVLWPPDICNPSLDWFNICVVHRALGGVTTADFPDKTEWQRRVTDPASFVKEGRKRILNDAIQDLKRELPVVAVKKKERKDRRVHQALIGEQASISDYLPQEVQETREENEGGDNDSSEEYDEMIREYQDFGLNEKEGIADDLEIEDVGEENPVLDFKNLVRRNRFDFAASSLLVVVRRLIRDVIDDDKAIRCLQALRETSMTLKKPRMFNEFVMSLVRKCKKEDSAGNRSAAFLRHARRRDALTSAVGIIMPEQATQDVDSQGNGKGGNYLEFISKQVREISSRKVSELSTSAVTS